MTPEFGYGLGSLGAPLLPFGDFLTVWRRADHTEVGRCVGTLLAGAAGVSCALSLPDSQEPEVPDFLRQ